MPKKPHTLAPQPARLSQQQVLANLPLIERRLAELKAINVDQLTEENGDNVLAAMVQKINSTLRDTFGANTIEYNENAIESLSAIPGFWFEGMDESFRARRQDIKKAIASQVSSLETLRDILKEKLNPGGQDGGNGILRAYEGLDLHKDIARAASKLYVDEHYANAVKALNNLVRLRSGLEVDGTTLMEQAFSPSKPVLKFMI